MKLVKSLYALIGAVAVGACIGNVSASELKWKSCLEGYNSNKFECTTIQVPMDYQQYFKSESPDDYNGSWIDLALVKRLATNQSQRIGSILVNPGGPGLSGIDTVIEEQENFYGKAVQERFDYIGFDPRGVARTLPLTCSDDEEKSAKLIEDLSPTISVNNEDYWLAFRSVKNAVKKCRKHSGEIVKHMSTADVAHDMEQIRRALGEEHLNYIGFSYGTFLGLTYTNLYPDHVGRMILDGVMNPFAYVGDEVEAEYIPTPIRLGSYEGAEDTLDRFFFTCDQAGIQRCAIAGDSRATFDQVYDALEDLASNAKPEEFEAADGRFNVFVSFIQDSITSEKSWSHLALVIASERELLMKVDAGKSSFKQAIEEDKRARVTTAVNDFTLDNPEAVKANPRIPELMKNIDFDQALYSEETSEEYYDNALDAILATYPNLLKTYPEIEEWFLGPKPSQDPILLNVGDSQLSFLGVFCSDSINPKEKEQWFEETINANSLSSYRIAQAWTLGDYACLNWPTNYKARYEGAFSAQTEHGILVMNTLADAATPYSGAVVVRNLQSKSRLVTVSGAGHGTAGLSTCADDIASHYLLSGELPDSDQFCEQDVQPFSIDEKGMGSNNGEDSQKMSLNDR